ncbi:MAG: DEAD/DEAH box helicase, partial [Gallionella sp.]
MSIVRVALDIPLPSLFDYSTEEHAVPGQRVIVPFGRRQMVGVVMECAATSDMDASRIKPVTQLLHDGAPLSPELLDLLRFCSDYYRHPIGPVVLSALPTRLRSDKPLPVKPPENYRLSAAGAALNLADFPKRKVVQRRILARLAAGAASLTQLKDISATVGAQLKALLQDGYIEHCDEIVAVAEHKLVGAHTLTDEQQQAVDAVEQAEGYACFLLHGVTGSGKTEVYVHLMHDVLARGCGQVLLLVPEINLTPQLEQYFRSRFPDTSFASLHSGLSEGERLHNWQQAQSGAAQIVLGTRLSVFAELPRLALIIVDEEHDGSFKQQDGLRYSARDV